MTFNAFLTSMGCTNDHLASLLDSGLIHEDTLARLDEADITSMAALIRKDEGMTNLSFIVEKNLKIAVAEARTRKETSRPLNSFHTANATEIPLWLSRQKEKESWKDPTGTPPDALMIAKNWVKGYEVLEHWISIHVLEPSHIPLAFLVREGEPNVGPYDADDYTSLWEEYAKRTAVTTPLGRDHPWTTSGRAKIWNILFQIFKDHPAFQYIRSFKRSKDGRGALFALKGHYLGRNMMNNMASNLEAQYAALTYSLETRRTPFESYVNKHVELFNIAEDLKQFGYSGIDPASRVRKFVNGIKTTSFDAVKNQIWSNIELQNDFDRVVNLFHDNMAQRTAGTAEGKPSTQIAPINAKKDKKDKKRRIAQVSVKDRYYTPDEYATLSKEEKDALRALRRKRTGGKGNKGNGGGGSSKGSSDTNRAIQAIQASMDSVVAAVQSIKGSEEQDGDITNRTNPALRQRRGGVS